MPALPTGTLLSNFFGKQSKNVVLLESVLAVFFIGFFDYVLPYQFSMSIFYSVPILIAAWYADKKSGDLTAIVSLLVTWWTDEFTVPTEFLGWVHTYRMFVRLFFFLAISMGAAALRARRDLAEKQIELLEHTQSLEREIIRISEREQQRIGQDLHDGLCQYLAALTCAATSLKNDLAGHPMKSLLETETRSAGEIAELLKQGVTQARNLSRGLSPVNADESGLDSALQELTAYSARMLGIECEFETAAPVLIRDNVVAGHLYRIAQESLNNATRHGCAKRVVVSLTSAGGAITLRIIDNGIGLLAPGVKSNGMGMKIMDYRARLIGGELTIANNPGGGVTVTCTLQEASAKSYAPPDSAALAALNPATTNA